MCIAYVSASVRPLLCLFTRRNQPGCIRSQLASLVALQALPTKACRGAIAGNPLVCPTHGRTQGMKALTESRGPVPGGGGGEGCLGPKEGVQELTEQKRKKTGKGRKKKKTRSCFRGKR